MNIVANNVAGKLFVALVAAAMLLMVAAPAKAATVEELQAQIAALMAQIAALSGGTAATPSAACTFTRSLTVGSQGADVKCLQDYLTPTYFKNAGGSTGYFGPVTAAAVAAWQSANGVMPAAGYFGPISQAKYTALAAATPTTPGSDDSSSTTLTGEADLNKAELSSADDSSIEEGAKDAELGELKLKFKDGDASINRLDIAIASTSQNTWRILDNVSLWVDGEEVARMDADTKDAYLDETTGTLRFSGLDIVALKDKDTVITVAATLQKGIDSTRRGEYNLSVKSIRFFDADGVATTDNTTGDFGSAKKVTFSVEQAGFNDEILVKSSDSDPESSTLKLKDDKKSDWLTVFKFDIDTDDSVNDIDLDTVKVTLDFSTSPAGSFAGLVDDAQLVIDGTTITDYTVGSTTGATTSLTFDVDSDVTIDAGDRVGAELKLRFKSLASSLEGATVKASVTGAGAVSGEGSDDVNSTGSAVGDVHTLRSSGIDAALSSASSNVTVVDGPTNDYGTYTMVLNVTAFDQDVFLSTNPATSTTWSLVDGAGVAAVAGTRSVTLSSDAKEESGYFKIAEGETKKVTIKVTYTPGAANTAARLQLGSLEFAETGVPPTDTWTAVPNTTYRTDIETIVG